MDDNKDIARYHNSLSFLLKERLLDALDAVTLTFSANIEKAPAVDPIGVPVKRSPYPFDLDGAVFSKASETQDSTHLNIRCEKIIKKYGVNIVSFR